MNNVYYTKEESLDMLEKLLSKKFKKLNLRKTGSFYDDNLVTITKKSSYEDENLQIKLLDNVNSIAVLMNNKAYIESGIDHMIFEITLFWILILSLYILKYLVQLYENILFLISREINYKFLISFRVELLKNLFAILCSFGL